MHSANLYFLCDVFRPFTFNVIIEVLDLAICSLLVLFFISWFLSLPACVSLECILVLQFGSSSILACLF